MTSCTHPEIVEASRDPDGSIWGRCTQCGEDDFPIRDVAYERFLEEAPEAQYECSFQRMAKYGEDYPTALRNALASAGEEDADARD